MADGIGPGAYGTSAYGSAPYGGGEGNVALYVPSLQTLDFSTGAAGTIPSPAAVYGPALTHVLAVGPINSGAAVYGPGVGSHLVIGCGQVGSRGAVFAPSVTGPVTPTDAQQVIALPGATGGTATLTFDGQTTAPIAWNANAAAIQAALVALSNLAPGDVVVTMGPWPAAVIVTFGGAYAGMAVATIIVDATGLVGGTGSVHVPASGGEVRPRITVTAISRATGLPIAALPMSHHRRWLPELNDVGSGRLTLRDADPALGAIGYFDRLQFSLDDVVRFTAVVRKRVRRQLAQGEEAAQGADLSGPGVGDLLRSGGVWPYDHPAQGLIGDRRVFNFASLDYDDTEWATTAVETPTIFVDAHNVPISAQPFGFPSKWPDPSARWLWDRYTGYGGVPAGDCYFRTRYHLAAATEVEVWAAADDAYELWVDGEPVVADMATGVYLGQSASHRLFQVAGDHLVAMHARNTTEGLKAGALWTVLALDAAGAVTTVIARSSTAPGTPEQEYTRMVAYPATAPGFTVGHVLRLLLAEAQGRGACAGVTLGFTDTADSAGQAWPTTADIGFPVGTDLLSVVKQLAESYFDWRMSPQLVLDCWTTLGTTRAVPLIGGAPGANLTEVTHEGVV